MTKIEPWRQKKMLPKSVQALSHLEESKHDLLSVKSNFEAEARGLDMVLLENDNMQWCCFYQDK